MLRFTVFYLINAAFSLIVLAFGIKLLSCGVKYDTNIKKDTLVEEFVEVILSLTYMRNVDVEQQERRPSLAIKDHFRKIVIVGDDIHRKEDELGVLTVGQLDFLTDMNLLEQG